MKKPLIVINFKTYLQGKNALKLAKIIEKFDKKIIIGVQPGDIELISEKTKLSVFAQHVDPFIPGRNTGFIIPEDVKSIGAKGTFINHSEHKIPFKTLKETVKRCKSINLKVLIFASSLKEAMKIKSLKPDYIVIEPPELVAGKKSVSEEKPELIKNIAKRLNHPFLVGAGIHSKKDVDIAMKLRASGIALSSAVTTSKNPNRVLKEILL